MQNLTDYLGQVYVIVDAPLGTREGLERGLEDVVSDAEEYGVDPEDLPLDTLWFPETVVLVLFTDDTPAPILNRTQEMFEANGLTWRAVPAVDYPKPAQPPATGLEILAVGGGTPLTVEAALGSVLPPPERVLARGMAFEAEAPLGSADTVVCSNAPHLHPMVTWCDSIGALGGAALVAPQLAVICLAERVIGGRDAQELFRSVADALQSATYVGSDGTIDTLRYFPTSCGQFGEG